jgi:ATP-dependent Clp protease ATP-binding subunit ClpC
MFERYTETARRAIFFARYEASQYGSARIETEHLLLGILREDKRLARSAFTEPNAGETIRKEIEAQVTRGARTSTSVEMPLSEASQRILLYAAHSAESLGHQHVETVHLLLGILREKGCLAFRILEAHGVEGERIRKTIAAGAPKPPDRVPVSAREKEIRALEAAMMAAAAEKGADGYMSFYAEDAVELGNGSPALLGKETIGKTMSFLNDKNNRLTWAPVHVDVSESGDLAYSFGNYEFRSIGKDGKPAIEHGKYTTIWKKQKDGRWKVVLDMDNSSPEPKDSGSR